MKKLIAMTAVILTVLTACEKSVDDFAAEGKKSVTFAVQGDFGSPYFSHGTRATLSADGKDMTDLWVLDYQDGTLMQQVHQTAEDEDFGEPSLELAMGDHHVYFVASRGEGATLSTAAHKLTWVKPHDTFWKDYNVSVTSGSASAYTVTLNRVATKLQLVINDAIADGTAKIEMVPATWYYGWDYISGTPTDELDDHVRAANISEQRWGQTGVNPYIFGLSGTTEWTTDISVIARDADDDILGQAAITDAPFKANRVTNYDGNLFISNGGFSLTLNATWDTEYTGSW